MKGGVVLSLGAMRRARSAAARTTPRSRCCVVCDEEWRKCPLAHVDRFAGWDACLCFEGGERTPDGDDGVVVRRKAAGHDQGHRATAAPRTPAPRPTAGATRCSRSASPPARWPRATTPTGPRT